MSEVTQAEPEQTTEIKKEQKKELSPQLAEKSGSHLITRVGNVVVLYRLKPVEQK